MHSPTGESTAKDCERSDCPTCPSRATPFQTKSGSSLSAPEKLTKREKPEINTRRSCFWRVVSVGTFDCGSIQQVAAITIGAYWNKRKLTRNRDENRWAPGSMYSVHRYGVHSFKRRSSEVLSPTDASSIYSATRNRRTTEGSMALLFAYRDMWAMLDLMRIVPCTLY